jgi:hypothetical protein
MSKYFTVYKKNRCMKEIFRRRNIFSFVMSCFATR